MQRRHISPEDSLAGYDTLQATRFHSQPFEVDTFSPNAAYDAYFRIHKVFVGISGGQQLEGIASILETEAMPRYLDVAGWSAAEAGLVRSDRPAVERAALIDRARRSWERALSAQQSVNETEGLEWLREDSATFRLALNLAYVPVMQALVAGNVTPTTRERAFADTLAIAQLNNLQSHLALQEGDIQAVGDHVGFGHECNALLTLLYLDDPRHVPLPSSARAGSGCDYREQTHDVAVINQHWGDILKVIPVEIKAAASRRDLKRYNALIVRGKMHLSTEGKYHPAYTQEAFAAVYEGRSTPAHEATVAHATSTLCDLLQLYQRGERLEVHKSKRASTRFHRPTEVAKNYKELSLDRAS